MFEAATGEGEEAAATSADIERPEKVTPAAVRRLFKFAEKLQKTPDCNACQCNNVHKHSKFEIVNLTPSESKLTLSQGLYGNHW